MIEHELAAMPTRETRHRRGESREREAMRQSILGRTGAVPSSPR